MSNVIDLAAERARRRPDGRAASKAAHPSAGGEPWPELDLQPFLDVIDKDIRDLARLVDPPAMQRKQGESLYDLMQRAGRPRLDRGPEPIFTVHDETYHFDMRRNSAWEKLMADILAGGAAQDEQYWVPATPERRAEADRLVRILRSTDQGSHGGDAESHQSDEGAVPRRPRGTDPDR